MTAEMENPTYDLAPPDPAGTIESLTALGYTLEAAIADLVDNSIDAGSSTIDITFHWAGSASYILVVDDGKGMAERELQMAMSIASRGPRTERGKSELGRFGMGLKTASFSQASRLTVWTRRGSRELAHTRVWDLDRVISTGEWQLLHDADPEATAILASVTAVQQDSGTIVLWQQLTKLVDELVSLDDEAAHHQFLEAISRVEAHLAMTFGRFLAGDGRDRHGLTLRVNEVQVQPWDPFHQSDVATLRRPEDRLELEGHSVVVRPFVLPPRRSLSDEAYQKAAGPRGWLEQQGFYIYRNDRLIVAGSWLGLPGLRSDEKHILARIAVEIPSTLDHAWSVDIRKATAHPPMTLRGSLTRTAKATRADAQRVLSAIGRTSAYKHADQLSFVWRPEHAAGDLRLRINWDHPFVKQALQVSSDARPVIKALLRFMEETVPLPALRMMFDVDTDKGDYRPFATAPSDEVVEVARRIYNAYVSQNLTPTQAAARLQHTSPFNEYPDLLALLQVN